MSFKTFRQNVVGFGLTLLLAVGMLGATATPAQAHETACPYCKLPVVQDTKELDNEVVLRYGNKRIEYRCLLCAIGEAKSKYKKDVTILAPSDVKGKPVVIKRVDGEWTTEDKDALFIYAKGSHTECQTRYRAVRDKAGFDAFVKANPQTLKDAKALTLKEMVELSK
jgi:hypothetical protein